MDGPLLHSNIVTDAYVSGKSGFELRDEDDAHVFATGFVYSTREDAEQAARDAALIAWACRHRWI